MSSRGSLNQYTLEVYGFDYIVEYKYYQTMKRILSVITLSVLVVACGGPKEVATPKGETEIFLPCSEFRSDRNTFRAFSSGESLDQAVAKKKALSNVRAELAGMISSTMKVVGDNYVKSSEVNNVEEVLERFEENARTVINQQLSGTIVVCDRLTQTNEGRYKYYIAIELSGDNIVKDYYKSLSKNDKLLVDYSYEKFKETFEKEMENMR
jgi:hypothetical protein